jgi:predicted TIM-barrel fold metal-dependent hydrolase
MDGKIAIEEHFVTPELEDPVLNPGWPEDAFRRTLDRLGDVDGELLGLGSDRFMFAADHPFEDVADGAGWFDAAPISEHDREKIGRLNVKRLLAL